MHARNFTTNVPKILDLKSSSEQIFSRKLSLGAPDSSETEMETISQRELESVSGLLERFLLCRTCLWLSL